MKCIRCNMILSSKNAQKSIYCMDCKDILLKKIKHMQTMIKKERKIFKLDSRK